MMKSEDNKLTERLIEIENLFQEGSISESVYDTLDYCAHIEAGHTTYDEVYNELVEN